MKVQKITIIGIGLIGGSLGMALKRGAAAAMEITGVDCNQAGLSGALECGAIDKIANSPVEGSDRCRCGIFVPAGAPMPQLVAEILPCLKKGAIITDVGSTKGFLRQAITALLPPFIYYIGGHPMAGGEKSGIAVADVNLFQDKMYIITPEPTASAAAVETIRQLVLSTGAKLVVMDADQHDLAAAVVSHVPHVAAAALVTLGPFSRRRAKLY